MVTECNPFFQSFSGVLFNSFGVYFLPERSYAMANTLHTGCLSFFTPNHAKHDRQWLQKGSKLTLVCFACFVEIIEDKNEPSIRKTRTLQEILHLITNGGILKVLDGNDPVLSHLYNCLWELTNFDENNIIQNDTVIEIIYQLCCYLKSQAMMDKVMEYLSQKLTTAENVKKVSPLLDLLGKLLQRIPELSENIIFRRKRLLEYIVKHTSFPDERIRSSLFFIFTHLYRDKDSCSAIPENITEVVVRECCEVLTSATVRELQINSIALLQSLTGPENLPRSSQALTENMEQATTSLKKAFLSRVDLVQSFAIGCLNNLMLFDEGIMNSDLTGFLFEVFKTKSDPLLARGFHCISQMVEKKAFYTKGHLLYGFETILTALMMATQNRNTKLVKQGFSVLAKIFGNCPVELSLITSRNGLFQCTDVLRSGLISLDDNVVLQACRCFSLFLESKHFTCDIPYSRLMALIELLVAKLEKTCHGAGNWNRTEDKDLKSLTIGAILEVISKSLDLAIYARSQPPSLESLLASTEDDKKKEVDQFVDKLLQLCDQVCIPNVVANLRKLDGVINISEKFFEILNKLLSMCPMKSKEMSKKFVASCFIRIALDTKGQYVGKSSFSSLQQVVNSFLEIVSYNLLAPDLQQNLKLLFRSSLNNVNGTAQELLKLLEQNNSGDETLRNTQECIVILFHLAYQNGDRLVTSSQLLHALNTFLVLNPLCYEQSGFIPRCLTQLFISELNRAAYHVENSPFLSHAQQIMAEGISKYVDNLNVVYFHDLAFVEWIVKVKDINPSLRNEVLELWFNHSGGNDFDAKEMELWKELVDRFPSILLNLASMVGRCEEHAQNAVLTVVRHVLSTCNHECQELKTITTEMKFALQQLFLNQAVEPLSDRNLESVLKLLCLLVTSRPKAPLDEEFMKLVYHVVNLLKRPHNSDRLCIECLNFLNASVVKDTKSRSDQVLAFLLRHHGYKRFLENVIDSFHEATDLESSSQNTLLAAVLVSISYLTRFQNEFNVFSEHALEIRTEAVLPLLSYTRSSLLQFAANLFWASILQSGESFTNVSRTTEIKELHLMNNSRQKLSKLHLRMILVWLQNSLLQTNLLVQMSAVTCFEALLSFGQNGRAILQEPWNRAILREVKDSTSPDSLSPVCLQLYSLFLHHERTEGLVLDFPVTGLLRITLEKFWEYEAKSNPNHEKWLSACAKFFGEIIQCRPDAMTAMEMSKLRSHVELLIDSYNENEATLRQNGEDVIYVQELLIHEEVIQEKRNDPLKILKELLVLLK